MRIPSNYLSYPEILTSLGSVIGGAVHNGIAPNKSTVQNWKDKYLAIWDAEIDSLSPMPGFKEQRRKVIIETFDRLLNLSR
jgi:hypothetical protein